VDPSDWRLINGGDYLQGLVLTRKEWRQSRPHWDHDHCELCWATFGPRAMADAFQVGYTDQDEYRWVCETCFADFREHYGWQTPT
jgi:hypothetical protein